MKTNQIKSFVKEYKLYLAVSFAVLTVLTILLPLFFVKSVANKQYVSPEKENTKIKSLNPLFPTVVVFTTEEDKDVQANFVTLKRKYIVGWQVKEISFQEVNNRTDQNPIQEVITELKSDIKEELLEFGDNVDTDKVSEYDQKILDLEKSNSILGEFEDESGDMTLQLVSEDEDGSYMSLNGNRISVDSPVASPAISANGKTICYTKYSLGNVHAAYSGTIYCMSTSDLKEYLLFTFNEGAYMSLGVNNKYIVYSLGTGEIGVIGRTTKKQTEILKLDMFAESDPNTIVYVDEEQAVIQPNDKVKLIENNDRIITLDLRALTWTQQ